GAHVYNRLKRLQRRPIRPPHRDSSPRADPRARLVSAAAPLAPVGSRHRVSAAPPMVAATIAPASAPVALVATALAVPTSPEIGRSRIQPPEATAKKADQAAASG